MSKPFSFHLASIRGSEMSPMLQAEAKRKFVHRCTAEHVPAWAVGTWKGENYPVQFASDEDWLANTDFNITKDGKLAANDCYSRPTWPNDPQFCGVIDPKNIGESQ